MANEPLRAVDDDEGEQLVLESFEGLTVNRYRLNLGTPKPFSSMDADGIPLRLAEGDKVVVETTYLIRAIEVGSKYKGGTQADVRARIHLGKPVEGTSKVVGLERR